MLTSELGGLRIQNAQKSFKLNIPVWEIDFGLKNDPRRFC